MLDPDSLPPCPNCGQPTGSSLACLRCGTPIDEPPGSDHFLRLGLDSTVGYDPDLAQAHYLTLSRALHPDFKADAGDDERLRAVSHSALLNEARRVLADDQLRAEYLLELHHPGALERHKTLSPDFLMEVMELSEELEAAQGEGCADTIRRIASEAQHAIETRMGGVTEACLDTIERIAHQADPPAVSEADRMAHPHAWNAKRIATLLHQARVYRRILRDSGVQT